MATSLNSALFAAYRVFNGLAPRRGPRSIGLNLDFSVSNPLPLDLVVAQDMERIEWVQTIYIDNSNNSSAMTTQSINSNQKIICPPFAQGYFPILVPGDPKFIFSTAGTPIVPVAFLSMAMPCMVWNSVNVLGTQGYDGSTTITTGGTAQTLFGGVVPVNGFQILNPDASTDLWVSDSTTAAVNGVGSIRVVANGGGFETPPDYKPIGAVSIVAATTGTKITARRW
jgi:hypothetical protein